MLNRLVRWFTFAVGFALLPLAATLLLRYLNATLSRRALEDSPEILFFSLMICATALSDISELRSTAGADPILRILWSALLLGASVSAMLYGSFMYDRLATGGSQLFQHRLLYMSGAVAVTFLVLGTLVQIL